MQRRKFSREFKIEAVKLARGRCATMAQPARDLHLHINVLHKRVSDHGGDPDNGLPGHGQMRPEQIEIERRRCENAKLAEGTACRALKRSATSYQKPRPAS